MISDYVFGYSDLAAVQVGRNDVIAKMQTEPAMISKEELSEIVEAARQDKKNIVAARLESFNLEDYVAVVCRMDDGRFKSFVLPNYSGEPIAISAIAKGRNDGSTALNFLRFVAGMNGGLHTVTIKDIRTADSFSAAVRGFTPVAPDEILKRITPAARVNGLWTSRIVFSPQQADLIADESMLPGLETLSFCANKIDITVDGDTVMIGEKKFKVNVDHAPGTPAFYALSYISSMASVGQIGKNGIPLLTLDRWSNDEWNPYYNDLEEYLSQARKLAKKLSSQELSAINWFLDRPVGFIKPEQAIRLFVTDIKGYMYPVAITDKKWRAAEYDDATNELIVRMTINAEMAKIKKEEQQ